MQVWHMSGAGNDFAVVDARGLTPDFSALALELCRRLGADGFMAVDQAGDADFRLHFYNSDGSRGEMCGNGARCICRFAFDHGIAGEAMTVRTDAGLVYGRRLAEDRYRVCLNNPSILDLGRKGDIAYVELGDPGVPHAVVELPELRWEQAEDLREWAKQLRYDPAFPKGANVNFYTRLADGEVRVLTYERGVEDYTLACGTGCGSIASVLHAKGLLVKNRLTAHNKGGTLTVTVGTMKKRIHTLLLEGPATVLDMFEYETGRT